MMKKLLIILIAVMGIALSVMGVAAYNEAAETTLSQLTGKTVEQIRELKENGMRWGDIAKDAEQFEAFKEAMFNNMKERFAQLVEEGKITQEQADDRLAQMQERHENCTGEPNEGGFQIRQGMMGKGRRGN